MNAVTAQQRVADQIAKVSPFSSSRSKSDRQQEPGTAIGTPLYLQRYAQPMPIVQRKCERSEEESKQSIVAPLREGFSQKAIHVVQQSLSPPTHPARRPPQIAGNPFTRTLLMRMAHEKDATGPEQNVAGAASTKPPPSQHPELPPSEKGYGPYSYKWVQGDVFVRGVHPNDVKQLGLPACGLFAALSAVASVKPQLILQNIQHKEGQEWRVLLYAKGNAEWVEVNQELPVENDELALVSGTQTAGMKLQSMKPMYRGDAEAVRLQAEIERIKLDAIYGDPRLETNTDAETAKLKAELDKLRTGWSFIYVPDMAKRELWPALYTKAIAILAGKHDILAHSGRERGGYDDLTGITEDTAMEIVTGRSATLKMTSEFSADTLFTQMNHAWLNEQPVTAATPELPAAGKEQIDRTGVYYGHAYTVMKTWKSNGAPVVDLRNPWGTRYPPGERPRGANNTPEFQLPFGKFKELFSSVAIGSKVMTI